MSNDKMRGELLVAFEQYKESVARAMIGGGEGKRVPRILEGLSFADFAAGWQASRAAGESAYAAIIEDLERARIAGFDGYDFSGLKDRRGDQKVFEISIETELDCSLEDGEYTVRITNLLGCWLGTDDFGMIEDAVSEVIGDLILPKEGHTTFIAYESGERQDVFWTKWFEIVPVSAVVKP